MRDDERRAFERLGEKLVLTAADIWAQLPFDVSKLNADTESAVEAAIAKIAADPATNAHSIPVTGVPGAGKTHLLARARHHVQLHEGFLIYLEPKQPGGFWSDVATAMIESLVEPHEVTRTQLDFLLARLFTAASVPRAITRTLLKERACTPEAVSEATGHISRHFARNGLNLTTRSVLKALILLNSPDDEHRDIGEAYLSSMNELEPGERRTWGVHPDNREPATVAKEVSRLLSLVGPTVLAVDQIDAEVSGSEANHDTAASDLDLTRVSRLGDGLMEFWHESFRTVTVLSCFDYTWTRLRQSMLPSSLDRFGPERPLRPIPNADVATEVVTAYLASRFADLAFEPPHPLWPLDPSCMEAAVGYTPRRLIQLIRDHSEACLRDNEVRVMRSLEPETVQAAAPVAEPSEPGPRPSFDALVEQQLELVDVTAAYEHGYDHLEMARLPRAALETWTPQDGVAPHDYLDDTTPPGGAQPAHRLI